ncbi:PIF1-like helicase-domain-containing protein [Cubamyces lactineus]|nr:PIF1-like helicase-domain-containing protein [Cubamyces lactineus]
MSKQKYYAVHNGRQGTQIYTSWEEVEDMSIAHSQHAMVIDGPTAMSTQPPPSTAFGDFRMNVDAPAQPELPPPQEIQLSPEQQHVLDMVKQGKSVFFTGSAGTGKSVLLREIIKLRGGRPSVRLGVTASTGIASVNIGGCTLHSWAGIGLGKEDQDTLVGKILGIASRDKVLDRWRLCQTLIIDESELFDKLEYIGRQLRKNELPFGGIQVGPLDARQFVDMLNAMRYGRMNTATTKAFRDLSRTVKYTDGIEPTELYPTRQEVDSANSQRLKQLPDASRLYHALDLPGRDEEGHQYPPLRIERALRDVIVPKVLALKNIIQGLLVNGSIGRVDSDAPNAPGGSQARMPTSTPSRSQSTDQREQMIQRILRLNTVWPAVQFQNGVTQLCVPLSFEVVSAEGSTEVTREQVPLILAWALSIHKSQGQTLERVRVDLNRIFEKGQGEIHPTCRKGTKRQHSLFKHTLLFLERRAWIHSKFSTSILPSEVRAHPRVLQWMSEHAGKYLGPAYIEDQDVDEELEYWKDIL